MYSKLEEASFPLVSDPQHTDTKFTNAGAFNPSKIYKHASRQSFFVWKLSDKLFEIHEITSSKQLQHNRFTYDFAAHQIQNDTQFYLLPQVECIEYNDNGQPMIAFHLLSSHWTLFQFRVFHPQKWNEENKNASVLHHLQQADPSATQLLPIIQSSEPPLSFKMFDLSKILLCSSTQLMMINPQDNNEPFMIHKKESPKSLFSSFLPSALAATPTECAYVRMAYHKPVASRTIIGCLDNKCHFELYLLSTHKRIDHKVLDIPQNAHNLLFYGYRHEYGVCWFSVLLFYANGGGAVLQCQYKQNEDELVILNEFETLNGMNNARCLDAQIDRDSLWCVLCNESNDYDVFFCPIGHYVNNRNTMNAEKWKFQRMWKRSEYIHRILNSIQTEFNFDTFYEQMLPRTRHKNKKHKLHQLILNFWLNRLVDDPSLEFDNKILESQLKKLIVSEQMQHQYHHSHWNVPDIASFGVLNTENNNTNATMSRIKFESQLESLMIGIMDKKYPLPQLESKDYIKCVWTQYNNFFLNCLEKAKQFKRFVALSCVLNDSVILIKENGVSVVRNMDYSEQIEVYFDRCGDESDELNDFSEPPMRLHKFIGFCHHRKHNNLYHWFVACTWFYYQNSAVFGALDEACDTQAMDTFIGKHKHQIKHHTKKQLMRLYQIQQHDEFLRDIIALFKTTTTTQEKKKSSSSKQIWNETGLMSCIESSFASIVAARYSLLKSIYITFLYLMGEERKKAPPPPQMQELSDLLKGYFVLSFLSSSVYETKQYLGIYNTNYGPFREELLSNFQSSFRSGSCVAHLLRYESFSFVGHFFASPLCFTVDLMNDMFCTNHIDLVYAVIEFLFVERQFCALQKIVSFVHYISPLFKYLLGRCHIEMSSASEDESTEDDYAVQLMNECIHSLKQRSTQNEKRLLGLILTDKCRHNNKKQRSRENDLDEMVDIIYHLAPRDCIELPSQFVPPQNKQEEDECQPEYEWCVVLSFYFHLIKLYKNVLRKPQIVISFAQRGIELIAGEMRNCYHERDSDDTDELDNTDEMIARVRRYSGISSARARKLCSEFDYNLCAILLSICKSHFLLEIVFSSLVSLEYDAAYEYLIQFDDLFCAKQGIKAYVSSCCAHKQMEPILSHEWNESAIQFNEWRKYLLSFKKSNNIWRRTLNYKCLVELIIYNFALQSMQCHDSFCFDLLYTFAMAHKEYRSAAKYMFEYALRCGDNATLQFHCLCHVLSAMELLPGAASQKYLFLDFEIPNRFRTIFPRIKNIVTYKQIAQYYVLIQSNNYLQQSDESDLNVQQSASELYRNGLPKQALLLLDTFDADLQNIFDKMLQTLLFGSPENDLTWHQFEMFLLDYDDEKNHFFYTQHALKTILSFCNPSDNNFILPAFICNKMEQLKPQQLDMFIVPVCQLLLQAGQILTAIQIIKWAFHKTQVSIEEENYNYQNHSFWKIAHKLHAYCNTLQLKEEGKKLIKAAANWIARPQID